MIFEDAFGMKATPFSNSIPEEYMLENEMHTETLTRLRIAVEERMFCLLTAPSGCGKSTVLRKLRYSLNPRKTEFLYISDSQLTPRWMYNKLLEQVGCRGYFYRGDGKKALHEKFSVLRDIEKKDICCVIDEAHLLSHETIEELRFFLNCNMDSHTPVSLVLSGQPELKERLRSNAFTAIRQRVSIVCSLKPLNRVQTGKYVETHLRYSGCEDAGGLFSTEALDIAHAWSSGVPRLINKVCTQALVRAAGFECSHVNAQMMDDVIKTELL